MPATQHHPRTYRELFRTPEFGALFLSGTAYVTALTVSGLALGVLIYSATASPLLAALSMFGPSLGHLLGASALLSAADRLPPRAALAGLAAAFGVGTAAQATPGLPVWAVLALVLSLGTLSSVGVGVRFALLNEILPRESYLLGRSVLNMAVGVVQIGGFAVGGVLVTTLSPRGALLAGAALFLASAAAARLGLTRRPPRATGRPSVRATWRNNALLWSSSARRHIYLALWVPSGLIVGCESLFIPYAPQHAGLLFASTAVGMLAGDTVLGRFVPPGRRARLATPLRLLLALPYLVFAFHPVLPLAVAAALLASVGYGASLVLQERLMALTPDELSGHALGLHTSGMLAVQGVAAALAGALAQYTSPARAMVLLAAASGTVTLALTPGLRSLFLAPQPSPAAP
ncbi:MFS transporter [Kitasatospora sp. MAA4]|uniref:MFS transporter n=1 Tax=Kitasatospora sp. MAA4 TaxID=3035093 RepID=UPI0024738FEB|nr:MFS transporter [Kitasatospora sp. MAA4]